MKTILTNTKKLSAILFATAIASLNLTAQVSSSDYSPRYASLEKEQKTYAILERLNKLSQSIEEKIKFIAPSVNDYENSTQVLTKYEYSGDNNVFETSYNKDIDEITSIIAAEVKFKVPEVNDSENTNESLNEITSVIEEQIKFKVPTVNN